MIKDKEKEGERDTGQCEREKEPIWSIHIREKRQSERWSEQRERGRKKRYGIYTQDR